LTIRQLFSTAPYTFLAYNALNYKDAAKKEHKKKISTPHSKYNQQWVIGLLRGQHAFSVR
jgi:hypothetical protein